MQAGKNSPIERVAQQSAFAVKLHQDPFIIDPRRIKKVSSLVPDPDIIIDLEYHTLPTCHHRIKMHGRDFWRNGVNHDRVLAHLPYPCCKIITNPCSATIDNRSIGFTSCDKCFVL